MKVEVEIDETLEESKIVIFTSKITNEVQEIINKLKRNESKIYTGTRGQKEDMHNCECILCGECVDVCPKKAIKYKFK